MKKTTKIAIASIITIVFAVVFYIQTFKMSKTSYQLPRILIGIIILLAIGMYLESRSKARKEAPQDSAHKEENNDKLHYDRVIIFILAIATYIFTIKILGYFIVTPIFIVGIFMYLKALKLKSALIIAAFFTIFVYMLFIQFLHLPIPITMF
ncbi:MAG: hypothetical protein GT601_15730 [Acidaminobacter sp.]|uniref:tripartite tricarboxylate transporter TctB family protein n=1 Tax=Acidaminobacter sp. TaxID=1872102 RepID=UPI00137EB0DC|nr:tripartite tricarboxylate transporter TctB family protein [Acidaminobacter sp.]MZQ99115.1 hypothetical protein [Acidaminobacter sp.]